MNNREFYLNSPVNRFYESRGEFHRTGEKFYTRTFNRRLKMKDTFTNIIPLYTHESRTCYQHPSFSHYKHEPILHDIMGKPLSKMNREYTHKMDEMKTYSEEMYKLGKEFAP